MTISIQFVNITVNDVDEALAFYRDALGFEVRNDVGQGSFRWLTLGLPGSDAGAIVLSPPHAGRSQGEGDALQELLVKGSLPMVVYSTDDLDATFAKAVAAGAEVLQEPIAQDWGQKDCAFRDPSGNMVRMAQA